MTTIETATTTGEMPRDDFVIDHAQLAAVAFLARYSGRTLDVYRHDLRGFFRWAADTTSPDCGALDRQVVARLRLAPGMTSRAAPGPCQSE